MEINRNQITDRLRRRNSGARTTCARLSLYSALSVYDQHAFLSSIRFVRFARANVPFRRASRFRSDENSSLARARGIALERKETTEQDHPRFSRLTRPPNEIFSSITIDKRFARPR
jgi:hypothetical protein